MRRILAIALLTGLITSPLGAPSGAALRKPVKTTLYMHGTVPIGEAEDSPLLGGPFMPMNSKKPSGDVPKSQGITNAVGTPNTLCAGNPLFPVWSGKVVGTIKGNIKLKFWFAGTPGNVDVRVWPDVSGPLCNESYPKPRAKARVLAIPGENVVVLKGANFRTTMSLLVQISPVNAQTEVSPAILPPVEGRVLYDSKSTPTSLAFSCIPKRGRKCA